MMFTKFATTFILAIATQCKSFGTHLLSSQRVGLFLRGTEYIGQPEDELTCDPSVSWDHHWREEANGLHGINYSPGKAHTKFAHRFGHLSGKKVKAVSESMNDFYRNLGHPIHAYYKTMVADLVETMHLALYCARFQINPIWSLGLVYNMDELLKNYPEKAIAADIKSSMFETFFLDEAKVRADAKLVKSFLKGKSGDDITAEFHGEGISLISEIAKAAKDDDFWMYHRFFGFGLIAIMEMIGIEPSDETEPIMEKWVVDGLGKKDLSSRVYSDLFEWKKRGKKLEMMEILMNELEIREKKRRAQRLQEKAEKIMGKTDKNLPDTNLAT
uniref:Uncharacterized protein n=1 Tax=Leptocylindrus danicus TaxID=163516 RepID=A0A7S2KDI5_9STRA|mmetsp:Transcript_21137/g.31524  ORF Transcript_21137/g.31524 Transcript_21137/m.31524 type:complete len:329 (+) Transcript_21137:114-1100(+)